jgi:Asparagine synthase
LSALLRAHLSRPPCFVAFSGGRDSSAVLAVAVAVARADGLDLPIPVTERYPGVAEADEVGWQQLVIDHLDIGEWLRLEFHDDNDFVGPTARDSLLRHGLLWPPAVHGKANVLRRIGPGTLLTGEGGDEVFGARRVGSWPHMSRRTPTARREALRGVISSTLPRRLREKRIRAALQGAELQPWLKPATTARHLQLVAAEGATEPLRWDRSLLWLARRRGGAMGLNNYRLIAAEFGVTVSEPLLEPRFLHALGRMGRPFGFTSRTEGMRAVFGDVLPAALIERYSKAAFNQAFMGDPTHEFAERWDRTGVDPSMVDADRLRAEWLSERPSALSSLLLQAAWLCSEGLVGV